ETGGAVEAGGQTGLLAREAVADPPAGELRPREPAAAALGTEAPGRPRGPAAPSAARRRELAGAEPSVELVQAVVLRRLERERIDRPEVAHGASPSRSRLSRRRSCRTFAVSNRSRVSPA